LGQIPPSISPSLLFRFLPLEVGPLNITSGLGKLLVSSLSGVWGGTPAESEFGAF